MTPDTRRQNLKIWFETHSIPPSEKSYISQLINGKASFGEKAARRLEETYGMDKFYLDKIEYSNVTDWLPTAKKATRVPVISWVRAGSLSEINDPHLPGEADDWVNPIHTIPSPTSFALQVEGDSMTNTGAGVSFPDGCIIVVDPERAPKAGDYVIAKDVTNQKATFKKQS